MTALRSRGTASLSGTLELTYLDGFTASPGDSYLVLGADTLDGTFNTIQFPDDQLWITDYNTIAGTLTLSVALAGDINLDGSVDRSDAARLMRNLGQSTGATFADGDFAVTLTDLALLQGNLAITASPAATQAAVPEPTAITLAVLSLLGVTSRKSRRRG